VIRRVLVFLISYMRLFAWYLKTRPLTLPSQFLPICYSVTFLMLDTASSDVVSGTLSEHKHISNK